MSATNPGPRCPRCRRPLAAWRLNHCVYCGEPFPAELKEGFAEPESLKWVERPALPADLARKVEMLRILPGESPQKTTRSVTAILGGVAVPVFAALFYMLFLMIKRMSMVGGVLVLIAGLGVIGYLVTLVVRSRQK